MSLQRSTNRTQTLDRATRLPVLQARLYELFDAVVAADVHEFQTQLAPVEHLGRMKAAWLRSYGYRWKRGWPTSVPTATVCLRLHRDQPLALRLRAGARPGLWGAQDSLVLAMARNGLSRGTVPT